MLIKGGGGGGGVTPANSQHPSNLSLAPPAGGRENRRQVKSFMEEAKAVYISKAKQRNSFAASHWQADV